MYEMSAFCSIPFAAYHFKKKQLEIEIVKIDFLPLSILQFALLFLPDNMSGTHIHLWIYFWHIFSLGNIFKNMEQFTVWALNQDAVSGIIISKHLRVIACIGIAKWLLKVHLLFLFVHLCIYLRWGLGMLPRCSWTHACNQSSPFNLPSSWTTGTTVLS